MIRFGVYFKHQSLSEPPAYYIDLETRRQWKSEGRNMCAVNQGRDVQIFDDPRENKTELEEVFDGDGRILPQMVRTALNRGRSGQFTIGYPIPYAYEGHITSPRADEINFIPKEGILRRSGCGLPS